MIVATAGHVDHGKTSLVRRLTGVDTDRLPEEKRRGLTIDLGFAYAMLADGTAIGFVDVPGHERFLRNMLAGVLALDCALLIVAADDGPMPQTHEHLAILSLTGVPSVTAVVTKIDRVSDARTSSVTESVRDLLARNDFPGARVLAVSSETGAGLAALSDHLAALARTRVPPEAGAGFRMAVDRCFTLAGAGTVVTGTVAAGQVRVGDLMVLTPRGTQVRVRSIHVHDGEAEEARRGDRCALAIAGARLDRAKVGRGDWVVAPALHAPTTRLDALLRLDGEAMPRAGLPVHVHLGTGDVIGRVTPLSDLAASDGGFARIVLDTPVAALHGDRIVLRDHAARHTLAGGRVIDPAPSTRRRRLADRLALLQALSLPDDSAALHALLDAEGCVDLASFSRTRNVDPGTPDRGTGHVVGRPGDAVLVSEVMHATLRRAVLDALDEWHHRNPTLTGLGKATLLGHLRMHADAPVLDAVIAGLIAEGNVARDKTALRLPSHVARLDEADAALWTRVETLLTNAGLRSLRTRELADQLGRAPEETEQMLVRFEAFGNLLRVARNRFFVIETVQTLARIAGTLAAEAESGFPASDFAARTGVGRNLAVQILEFLDRTGTTRRVGELRHVVRSLDEALG